MKKVLLAILISSILLLSACASPEPKVIPYPGPGSPPPPPGYTYDLPPKPIPTPEPVPVPTPTPSPTPPSSPKYNWEILDLSYKVTEKASIWWKFSWQATLMNNTSSTVDFFINVNFLDQQGFIVDDDIENPPLFSPGEQRVIRGFALIDIDIARDVYDIEAEITAYIEN